jgi:hypothetical protein
MARPDCIAIMSFSTGMTQTWTAIIVTALSVLALFVMNRYYRGACRVAAARSEREHDTAVADPSQPMPPTRRSQREGGMKLRWLPALPLTAVLTLTGCSNSLTSAPPPDAQAIVGKLVQLVPTATPGTVFTAATDPNHLLGRPNGYLSKAAFSDTRAASAAAEGSVEVFPDEAGATARQHYITSIAKSGVAFAAEYDYLRGPVLLRVPQALTPEQAAEYEQALGKAVG